MLKRGLKSRLFRVLFLAGSVTGLGIFPVMTSAWGQTLPAPAAPSNLTATAVSRHQIDLRWQDNSSSETGFSIERKTGATGTFSQIATAPANATTYQSTFLSVNTTYYFRVQAVRAVYDEAYRILLYADSPYSNEASATTFETIPAAPSDLRATTVSSTQIDRRWRRNSNNEREFKIERKTGTAGTFSQIATAPANATTYQGTGQHHLFVSRPSV